jgi:hypothetical protein
VDDFLLPAVAFLWLLFGVVAAMIATARGSNGCLWLLIGIVLGPIALIPALKGGIVCRHCGWRISKRLTICPYCYRNPQKEAGYLGGDDPRDSGAP